MKQTFHLQLVNFIHVQFSNIMAVLGKQKSEMAAVHLMKSYCLWSLLLNLVVHSANVALNNSFRRIFNCCWRESPKMLLFYCVALPIVHNVDQCGVVFFFTSSQNVTIVLYAGF